MRLALPILLAALTLVASDSAEARRGRGGTVFVGTHTNSSAAASRLRPTIDESGRAGEARQDRNGAAVFGRLALPSVDEAAPPGSATPIARTANQAAGPWCAAGRVVGGFCVLN